MKTSLDNDRIEKNSVIAHHEFTSIYRLDARQTKHRFQFKKELDPHWICAFIGFIAILAFIAL